MNVQILPNGWRKRVAQLPNFSRCVAQFGLSAFEGDLLGLCASAELYRETRNMLMQAHGKPYPTFMLAMQILDGAHADALSPERPLRFWDLVDLIHPSEEPSTLGGLQINRRALTYMLGFDDLDVRLEPDLFEMSGAQTKMATPESQAAVVRQIVSVLSAQPASGRSPIIQLVGIDAQSKELVVQRIGEALGVKLYRLEAYALPKRSAELELFVRLWARESLLSPVALYLDAHQLDLEVEQEQVKLLQHFLASSGGLFFLSSREAWNEFGLPMQTFDVKKPTRAEQISLWQAQLGEGCKALSARLAGQFNLSLPAIERIGHTVERKSIRKLKMLEQVWQACLQQTRPRLNRFAQRIESKATWQDIVLPDAQMESLRQIAAQVQKGRSRVDEWGRRQSVSRSQAMTILFVGHHGTGKRLAAEILANHLKVDLYRVDFWRVVSQKPGQTKKNLCDLFDAADQAGAILFFDKVDFLFEKRDDAKTSHERDAKIEINYLRKCLESHQGLAILTTNWLNNLDDALMPRLGLIIKFPVPMKQQRQQIWQRIFPPDAPLERLDYRYLATFELTGGSIVSAALNAALMAASTRELVAMPHILCALQMEFDKSGRQQPNPRLFQWPR